MRDRIIIGFLVVILILLACNIGYTCYEMIDYEKRKDSGNERWKQVENRILQTEEKVESLEEKIRTWKN